MIESSLANRAEWSDSALGRLCESLASDLQAARTRREQLSMRAIDAVLHIDTPPVEPARELQKRLATLRPLAVERRKRLTDLRARMLQLRWWMWLRRRRLLAALFKAEAAHRATIRAIQEIADAIDAAEIHRRQLAESAENEAKRRVDELQRRLDAAAREASRRDDERSIAKRSAQADSADGGVFADGVAGDDAAADPGLGDDVDREVPPRDRMR